MNNPENPTSSTQQAKDKASQLAQQASDKSGEVVQQAQDTAKRTADQQKGRAADALGTVANAVRHTGQQLHEQDQGAFGKVADQIADRLDQFSNDLQNKNVDEIIGDVQDFARRDPQLFLGGAVVLGLLAARFLKSSSSRSGYQQYGASRAYTTPRAQPYSQRDLADYRRDLMNNEYSGSPTGIGDTPYAAGGQMGRTGMSTGAGSTTSPGRPHTEYDQENESFSDTSWKADQE